MKLVQIQGPTGGAVGVQLDDGAVAPLDGLLGEAAPATVAEALTAVDELGPKIAAHVDAVLEDPASGMTRGWLVAPCDVTLRAPIGQRQLIVCVGANYADHMAEMGADPPVSPVSFVKSCSAVIGPGEAIVLPRSAPDQIDYEGELCVVFSRRCHDVGVDEAMEYVGGFTLLNDVSARDHLPAMMRADGREGQWALLEMMMGKQFPTFAPIGPAVVTIDEIADPTAIPLTATVNGTVMQQANTADLLVDIPHLIAAMSRYYVFRPGDVMSTGSPSGVGVSHDPPVFLRHGDEVTISADGVGVLSNTVRAAG